MKVLINNTYQYILDYNIEKLTKSDKKIAEYINRIYPRCLIDSLAAYNKEHFKDEIVEQQGDKEIIK